MTHSSREPSDRIDGPEPKRLKTFVTGRDIVVIGASAGGIQALKQVAGGLPRNLRATVFVVVHSSPEAPSLLPELLSKAGYLPAQHAVHGERFRRGRIYVAPPDRHLLLSDGTMQVTLGPRENGFRPAVDPLFRTAAAEHGPRVVGIVLSGALDDGTRGLKDIKREGGIAIAQHIEEATIPQMPLSAIQNVEIDHILPAADMPSVITRLANERLGVKMTATHRKSGKRDVAQHGTRRLEEPGMRGPPSPFTCPECGGTLWEKRDGKLSVFQCHVGHGYTADALGASLDERVETAMWTALRTLEENVALQHRLAQRASGLGLSALAASHTEKARLASERAASLQTVLTNERSAYRVTRHKREKKSTNTKRKK